MERNIPLQVLRFVAALEVVFWHTDTVVKAFSNFRVATLYGQFGGVGVEVFFIISGFIMSEVLQRSVSTGKFLANRALRILPLYWIFTILVPVAYLINNKWKFGSAEFTVENFVLSFLCLPQNAYPILGVGWTLEHEALFYCLAALSIAVLPAPNRAIFVAILSLGLYVVGYLLGYPFAYHAFSEYWIFFCFGCTVSALLKAAWPRELVGVFLALQLAIFASIHTDPRRGIAAVICFVFIYWVAKLSENTLVTQSFARMGNCSFSLYLSHGFVLSIVGKMLAPIVLRLSTGNYSMLADMAFRVVGGLIAVVLSWFVYKFLEEPLHRLLHRNTGTQ